MILTYNCLVINIIKNYRIKVPGAVVMCTLAKMIIIVGIFGTLYLKRLCNTVKNFMSPVLIYKTNAYEYKRKFEGDLIYNYSVLK
jgi:hypothetical protein